MTTESNTISLMEYNYLKGKLFLLPKLPGTSDSIDLSYRTDNFLGDFSLNIRFCCSIKEQVDTTDKRWTILSIDKSTGKKRIDYYDNEN